MNIGLVSALETANLANDDDTGRHIMRVGEYSAAIAEHLGCSSEFCAKIKLYAPLHDVGKVGISDAILKKPGKYTPEEFEKMKEIKGVDAFNLFQSYGFPLEMIEEEAKKRNLLFGEKEKNEFENEFKKHQELSRTASAGKFKGGLADASVNTTKGHTATHLLLAALRKVLGEHVFQKGSNITPQRIRLDFSHNEKLSSEQISSVENLVNTAIQKNMPITMEEVSLEEAKNIGAMGVFEQKYQNKVKVYTIGDFSKEICGGPHILSTGELKSFKIIQETASSAGVRRIKAVVGK